MLLQLCSIDDVFIDYSIMSLNYAFGFSLVLMILVVINIYFFYTLNGAERRPAYQNLPKIKTDPVPKVLKEIYDYLNSLPTKYKSKNIKVKSIKQNLINSFNTSNNINTKNVWDNTNRWFSEESLFPHKDGAPGQILHAMRQAPLALVDNAPGGTQLKLLLLLENKKKLFFKPKRYDLSEVINGDIYAGFDRHNSEVFAYYLAMAMNYTWVAPAAIRRIHIKNDVVPVATPGLKKTMIRNGSGSLCIYGNCFFCKANATVCADHKGELEGAVILYLDKRFKVHKYPWRRSYKGKRMNWEDDYDYCKKVVLTLSTKRILNLIDVAILDFLLQNGDRHDYEVYKDRVVLLDNGKGLGNPSVDQLDILAPLYHCCMLRASTWQSLEVLSGGSLTDIIKVLASLQGEVLATEEHFTAVERRLLKVYATIQYCIGKTGSAKFFRLGF